MIFHQIIQRLQRQPLVFVVNANATNLTLTNVAGNPTGPITAKFLINAGVVIGSTSAVVVSLDTGQFPANSDISVEIYGSVQGAGGPGGPAGGGPAGNGGDAIPANYPNQKVTITIHPGGEVKPGGGGGGQGGAGGNGGVGGGGYYDAWSAEQFRTPAPSYYWVWEDKNGQTTAYWNNAVAFSAYGLGQPSTTGTPPVTYGSYQTGSYKGYGNPPEGYGIPYYYAIKQLQRTYTSGGTGGAGGTVRAGGTGQGYNQAAGASAPAAGGLTGAAGGINAGAGGTGGNSGVSGAGGTWGTAGGTGTAGSNGNPGANGNNGTGSAGTAGGPGSPGGAAGRAVVKGTANVTVTNNGTMYGAVV